jgi:hypothetical protein
MAASAVPDIMICPASGDEAFSNVQRTVAIGVSWAALASAFSPDTAEALEPLVDADGELRFWGFRENSRDRRAISPKPPQSWQRLVNGTVLVFIGSGRTTYTGVIGAILFDPSLSQTLWDAPEWPWVVGLVDVRSLASVSDADVRAAAGFERVQMAMPVRESSRGAVQSLLGGNGLVPPAAVVSSLAEIDPEAPLSVWALAERRNEQSLLRRSLVPNATAQCDLCGDELAATFVRVAHVKKRALCSDAEKRDLKNVLVACVWCDVAFEMGWLSLDTAQTVVVSQSLPATPPMSARLEKARGRQVLRELNPASLAFHRAQSFVP